MNWKKLVLAMVVSLMVLSMVAIVAIGAAVTAGVAVAGEAIRAVGDEFEVDVEEGGRLAFRSEDGARFSYDADARELVVTDAEGDRVRVVAPRDFAPQLERRFEQFNFDETGRVVLWPAILLAPLVALGKGLTFLASLGLIVLGVWLVLRYRRQSAEKAPKASGA